MNLKQLEHLLAITQSGSFSRAAETQHISQSALSRSILALEEDLGGRLLDRAGKRNELTPLGQVVVARARQVLDEVAELRRSTELLQSGDLGDLRVGLGSGPAALLMVPLICHIAQHHPGVHLSITQGPAELQLGQLRARQLDAMVVDVRRIIPAADLSIDPIPSLRGGFICGVDHPLAHRASVTLADVRAYPVGSTPLSDEVARELVALYGPDANPSQLINLQCEDIASLIATVEKTRTIFMGVVSAAQEGLRAGQLVELKIEPGANIGATFAYVTLSGKTQTRSMGLLREFVERHVHD